MSKNLKTVWIVNQYAVLPCSFGGTRHYDLVTNIKNRKLKFFIISSGFSNFEKIEKQDYGQNFYKIQKISANLSYVWLKTPPYGSNGLSRIFNSLAFIKQLRKLADIIQPPNLIVGSSPQLITAYQSLKIAKQFKIPFLFEVRDIWPQSLIDLGMSRYNPLILWFGLIEKTLILESNKIISIMPHFKEYAVKKFKINKNKIIWISNGILDKHVTKFKKSKISNQFTITYAGTVGLAQNSEIIIQAANLLRNYSDIHFNIIGDGVEKTKLINMTNNFNLQRNVQFLKPIPKEQLFSKLKASDVLLLSVREAGVFKFGCQPNKLFDYLAAGRPIIFSGFSDNTLIKKSNCGYYLKSNSQADVANAIIKLYNSSEEERARLGRNALEFVKKSYLASKLSKKLEELIIELTHE